MKLKFGLSAFVAFLLMLAQFPLAAAGQDMLVYENVFGNLDYGRYANQGQTNVVNVVPDFSRAGYKGGGVPIPFIPAVVTLTDGGPGDDTTRIQDAIDSVEAMRFESVFSNNTDENHGWNAVVIGDARDAWVRQVTAKHFAYSCVYLKQDNHFITVEDSAQLDPKSKIEGGRRYAFVANEASYFLFQRNYAS